MLDNSWWTMWAVCYWEVECKGRFFVGLDDQVSLDYVCLYTNNESMSLALFVLHVFALQLLSADVFWSLILCTDNYNANCMLPGTASNRKQLLAVSNSPSKLDCERPDKEVLKSVWQSLNLQRNMLERWIYFTSALGTKTCYFCFKAKQVLHNLNLTCLLLHRCRGKNNFLAETDKWLSTL